MSEEQAAGRAGLWRRMREGLVRANRAFEESVADLGLPSNAIPSEEHWQRLEASLIAGDFPPRFALGLVDDLRDRYRERAVRDQTSALDLLRQAVASGFLHTDRGLRSGGPPQVTLLVGVNGVGKTTIAGKLAAQHVRTGERVVLGAADTFRAAAIEQLRIWAQRAGAGVHLVAQLPGADPAAVAYDAVAAGVSLGAQRVIIDTAGRQHNKGNLMEELRKIDRVMGRLVEGAPHERLLVLDAPTGQNGLRQAAAFHEALGLTGIVLTKLDGSARGGVVLAVERELGVPVKLVGVGEGVDDLLPFDPAAYSAALFRA